jgi:hypothetical protein
MVEARVGISMWGGGDPTPSAYTGSFESGSINAL